MGQKNKSMILKRQLVLAAEGQPASSLLGETAAGGSKHQKTVPGPNPRWGEDLTCSLVLLGVTEGICSLIRRFQAVHNKYYHNSTRNLQETNVQTHPKKRILAYFPVLYTCYHLNFLRSEFCLKFLATKKQKQANIS